MLVHLRTVVGNLHPVVRGLMALAALVAALYTARLTVYMVDESRTSYSVLDREFFRNHSCLSSYTEAAHLASTDANVFDPAMYLKRAPSGEVGSRYIGTFEVDLYQYPPAFLVLPLAAEKMGLDFFTVRTAWFVIQIAILLGGLIVTAIWIGGTRGAVAAMFIPLLFLAPTTRVTLQLGNFQATAFPLAVLAMIAFASQGASRGCHRALHEGCQGALHEGCHGALHEAPLR